MDLTELMVRFSRTGAGSYVMWLMVGLSIASVAVMIERVIFFATNKSNVGSMAVELHKLFLAGSFDDAKKIVDAAKGYEARVVAAALDGVPIGAHAVKELAESAGKVERLRYERGLAFLGTLGNNAPFIGLFGTVLEIIAALAELGTQSGMNASAGAVMATLSAALAATAVGLIVALPAVAVFNYFQRRIKALQVGADALVHVLLAHVKHDSKPAKG